MPPCRPKLVSKASVSSVIGKFTRALSRAADRSPMCAHFTFVQGARETETGLELPRKGLSAHVSAGAIAGREETPTRSMEIQRMKLAMDGM